MGSVNLHLVKNVLAQAAIRPVEIVGLWDSNGTYGGWGWDHGLLHAMLGNGFQMYATGLHGLGESSAVDGGTAGQGNGHGYGHSSDADHVRHRSNSGLTTAMNAATCLRMQATLPHADLLKWWNARNAGDYAPINYVYAPAGTAWNGTQAVGISLANHASNPIGIASALRADLWLGEFPTGTTGSVQYSWVDTTSGVLASSSATSAGPDAGHRMRRVSLALSAGARVGASVEFRAPMGGSGQWFGTFCRVYNEERAAGVGVSGLFSLGSKGTYRMANAMIGLPDESLQHYCEALTIQHGSTRRCVIWITVGPNDLSETLKLPGAPSGTATDPAVVKYNVEQIVARLKAGWIAAGGDEPSLVFLLTTHPPREVGNTSMGPYQAKLVEIAMADPANVAALDASEVVTYAELSDNGADPTFASNGTDVNHLKNRASYELVGAAMMNKIFAADGGVASSGGRSRLGIGIAL